MAFGRRRRKDDAPVESFEGEVELEDVDDVDPSDDADQVDDDAAARTAPPQRAEGPRDFDTDGLPDLPAAWGRMDLGALILTVPDGVEVRLDVDEATQAVGSVAVVLDPLMLQVMVYAAPRTLGIWDEVRAEIVANATSSGGTVHTAAGRFDTELLAQLPAEAGGRFEARFIGVDGPRWFLRGVVSGPGAHDDQVSARALDVLSKVTVLRDDQARPPQELLPVTVPRDPQHRTVPLDT